jgi:hypothetical protein
MGLEIWFLLPLLLSFWVLQFSFKRGELLVFSILFASVFPYGLILGCYEMRYVISWKYQYITSFTAKHLFVFQCLSAHFLSWFRKQDTTIWNNLLTASIWLSPVAKHRNFWLWKLMGLQCLNFEKHDLRNHLTFNSNIFTNSKLFLCNFIGVFNDVPHHDAVHVLSAISRYHQETENCVCLALLHDVLVPQQIVSKGRIWLRLDGWMEWQYIGNLSIPTFVPWLHTPLRLCVRMCMLREKLLMMMMILLLLLLSQYSVWLRTGRPGFDPRQRQRIFPLTSASRQTLGPTHRGLFPQG